MSIADATDTALADMARTGSPPEKQKGPGSVLALGRAIAEVLTNLTQLEAEAPAAQAGAAALEALSDSCGDAAMRLAALALRKKGVSS